MNTNYTTYILVSPSCNVAINIDNKIDLIICIAQARMRSRIQQFTTVKPFFVVPHAIIEGTRIFDHSQGKIGKLELIFYTGPLSQCGVHQARVGEGYVIKTRLFGATSTPTNSEGGSYVDSVIRPSANYIRKHQCRSLWDYNPMCTCVLVNIWEAIVRYDVITSHLEVWRPI